MIKSAIKYSVLCGAFLMLLFWVSIKLGGNPLVDIRHFIFDLLVYFVFIYFASREFKSFNNKGILHFWQGMTIGFVVFIPAVILFCLLLYVIIELNPVLMDQYKQGAKSMLDQNSSFYSEELGKATFDMQYQMIDQMNAFDVVKISLRNKLISGFLITPIVSIILRKKPI